MDKTMTNNLYEKIDEAIRISENHKIAVIPYGKMGVKTANIIKNEYSREPDLLVDNYKSDYYSLNDIEDVSNFIWLISVDNPEVYCEIKQSLIAKKISNNMIIDLYGNEERIIFNSHKLQQHYDEVIINIKKKQVLSFGAYVVFGATFNIDALFRYMIADDSWEPRIVIVPIRKDDEREELYNKTKKEFVEKYGKKYVLDGYDEETRSYVNIDASSMFDVVYCANLYDCYVDKPFKIKTLSEMNVLPFCTEYSYNIGKYTTIERLCGLELNYVWRCFTDTNYSLDFYKEYQYIKGENVRVTGFPGTDEFVFPTSLISEHHRKTFLICSHHTIENNELPLSCFLKYKDFILGLPDIFPEADFVFRPHPLRFSRMIEYGYWTQEDKEDYLKNLDSIGIEYSDQGDYLDLFNRCDAIINDCGSFTVEWLFTGKPGCFVWNENLQTSDLTPLMNFCLQEYTIAENENDIIGFINSVIDENYIRSEISKESFYENVAINHPNVTEFLLKEIDVRK